MGGTATAMTRLSPVPFVDVRLTGDFWSERLNTVLDRTIPSQHAKLEEMTILASLRLPQPPPPLVIKRHANGFSVQVFWDSDVGKWIEAASYALAHRRDATIEAQMLMSAIVRTGNRFGAGHIIDIVTGAETQKIRQLGHDQLKTYGVGKEKSKRHFQAVVSNLLAQGWLQQSGDKYPVLQVAARASAVLEGKAKVRIIKPVEKAAPRKAAAADDMACNGPLFEVLRALRKQMAEKQGVPPFVVFSDRTLREMSARMPGDANELLGVSGVGTHKQAQYGAAFLEAIRAFRQENPEAT